MKRHLPLLILAATFLLCALPSEARKIRTTRKIPRTVKTRKIQNNDNPRTVITPDSVAIWDEVNRKIRFYGFDKTAGSSVESVFITNGLDSTLTAIGIDITYLDMQGRQLHRQHVDLDCTIPPGETMRSDFRTWDTQKSFYFHQSAAPRRQATPFDVRIELMAVTLGH